MAGGLIGMNLERGQQAQSTLLGLAARESAMNTANQQIEAAKKAGQLTTIGTGAGVGARLGVAAAEKAATTAAAGTPVAGFFSPTGGAAALNTGATAAGTAAAGTTAAAEGAAAATTAASTAGAGGAGGTAGMMAAAPWVLGGMAVAYLLSELFD